MRVRAFKTAGAQSSRALAGAQACVRAKVCVRRYACGGARVEVCVCVGGWIYIYIYIERERDGEGLRANMPVCDLLEGWRSLVARRV